MTRDPHRALVDSLSEPTSERTSELARARARAREVVGPSLVKASVSWEELCNRRAKEAYRKAVKVSGGWTATGVREGHHESTVRARVTDDDIEVHLKHAFMGLDRAGMYALATELMNFADETESRRVG